MANLQLNLHLTPLLSATSKLNSDEENTVSCFQDKAELYGFPYENIYLVIKQFLLPGRKRHKRLSHFPLHAIKKIFLYRKADRNKKIKTIHRKMVSSQVLQWTKSSKRQQHRSHFHISNSKLGYPLGPQTVLSLKVRIWNYNLLKKGISILQNFTIWSGTQPGLGHCLTLKSLSLHHKLLQDI